MRFSGATGFVALACALAPASSAGGAVVLEGRILDGEASSRVVLENFRNQNENLDALKVPWADKDVAILLVKTTGQRGAQGADGRWSVRTGAGGEFRVDTGLESVPEGSYFVAVSSDEKPRYSPFFRPGLPEARSVNLYPLTESTEDLFIPSLHIVHDFADPVPGTGVGKPVQYSSIRVRVALQIWNRGGSMYVGRRESAPHRSVWKIPLPEGAKLVLNRGPDPGTPGFTPSEDGRWLILDSPIPGLSDIKRFGNYEAHFIVPATQTFVHSYPIFLPLEGTRFAVWCVHDEMAASGPGFMGKDSKTHPDPLGSSSGKFDVIGAREGFSPGQSATIVLDVDNVPLGQISSHAAKWVGGFILLLALAALAGLALGRKGPAPEALFAGAKGEEILDRIADLDAQHARKAIREKDYHRYREMLLALAAEELGDDAVPAARGGGPGAAAGLPAAARDILRRIDELDRNGASDPARIAERAHLLEALAKALPRERPRG